MRTRSSSPSASASFLWKRSASPSAACRRRCRRRPASSASRRSASCSIRPIAWRCSASSRSRLIVLYFVLYRTRIGMIVRAGIEDSAMVDALGIDVYKVFMFVFGIGAMAAGFAGIVNAPVVSIAPDVGEAILVQTFVVVVIGGVGSFPGAVLGGLIAGEIISITSMFNPGYSYVMLFVAMTLGARAAAVRAARHGRQRVSAAIMFKERPYVVEALTAIGLIVAPFVLPHLGFSPTTVNRILIWGLFGVGFDILFGFTGLLSFGQSAFFGTGGMVAAYSADADGFHERHPGAPHRHGRRRRGRLSRRLDRAPPHRHLFRHDHGGDRGGVLLRRVQSDGGFYRRREWAARRADALGQSRFHDAAIRQRLVDVRVPRVLVLRRHGDRAAHRAFAGRRDPAGDPRQSAARRGGRPQYQQLQADGLRGGRSVCRLRRWPARRDAGVHAARRLHVRYVRSARDADRDRRRRHAVRPAGRRHHLALSQRLLSEHAASRQHLETGARHRVRAARDLPAARRHRRRQRPHRIRSGRTT